jgi:murein DD-endopeptidase MepM/ murein hydrolase activator NlpD
MTLLRWFPIVSTMLWLVTPAIGTKANPANLILQPSFLKMSRGTGEAQARISSMNATSWSQGFTSTEVGIYSHSTAPASLPATPVAELIVQRPSSTTNACPPPILSRLTRHKVAAGETLQSIASRYNLIPETLTNLNSALRQGSMPVGREILIPPFNGIRVQAARGSSWQEIAQAYGVRADILYEINGCQRQPRQVFIPGVNWTASGRPAAETYTGFAGYPLPSVAPIALSYGWHRNSSSGQAKFHSGIDLLANPGTPVLAVDTGTVAFAAQQDNYGNLVVINHQGGRQTRYAHLEQLRVRRGQQVNRGDTLGTVGSTGRPDTDKPHLHFEVRYSSPQGWVAQDPEPNLKVRPSARR